MPTSPPTVTAVGGETSGSSVGGSLTQSSTAHQPQFLAADDSDTSDDGSDDEVCHPDPHPIDPDMTGWSDNQIGCYFYGKYNHFKKKWRNFQDARK